MLGAPDGLLVNAINKIDGMLDLDNTDSARDKLLIYGHSLGGNTLVTAFGDVAANKARQHSIGSTMSPVAGDLVVLFNPASEAYKWNNIQRAEREAAGFSSDVENPAFIQSTNVPHYNAVLNWRAQYPIAQRPVMISITATDNWNSLENTDGKQRFDRATGMAFPLYKVLINEPLEPGYSLAEQRQAISHYAASYLSNPHGGALRRLVDETAALGVSHDFSNIDTAGQKTRYSSSGDPQSPWCEPETGGGGARTREGYESIGRRLSH
ncbi:hypothetical protein [Paracoccus sp. JM45]|uniref:hypothetical protein n=1 Tax=Paracoccus sp. JM45 TaxID=2283626 RepID=UPI000E6D53AB|nr:hypothetical protein [Paracoccus sp. JM45]RJE78461.1 hypothetical protein DWB67_17610 [Paracoccus sp. JM45]